MRHGHSADHDNPSRYRIEAMAQTAPAQLPPPTLLSTTLPMPTVLIVDTEGIARFVDVQPDYTARTEVTEILDALAAMHPNPA